MNYGGKKSIRYGSLFSAYEGSAPDDGIRPVSPRERRLVVTGFSGESRAFNADPAFTVLKARS
jgi:hypothetical protein